MPHSTLLHSPSLGERAVAHLLVSSLPVLHLAFLRTVWPLQRSQTQKDRTRIRKKIARKHTKKIARKTRQRQRSHAKLRGGVTSITKQGQNSRKTARQLNRSTQEQRSLAISKDHASDPHSVSKMGVPALPSPPSWTARQPARDACAAWVGYNV